ncbi:unnamed protein product [Effrenium voratum]|nr:unnamed protein product [Effrenium voratum]
MCSSYSWRPACSSCGRVGQRLSCKNSESHFRDSWYSSQRTFGPLFLGKKPGSPALAAASILHFPLCDWRPARLQFSMLSSLHSITDAAYVLFHLAMLDELVKFPLPESE